VSGRTRSTNTAIAAGFAELAERQVEQYIAWIRTHCASHREIKQLEEAMEALHPEQTHAV
jgi:hypothetical protein